MAPRPAPMLVPGWMVVSFVAIHLAQLGLILWVVWTVAARNDRWTDAMMVEWERALEAELGVELPNAWDQTSPTRRAALRAAIGQETGP